MKAQYSLWPPIKRNRIESRIMNEESLRNRLHLADETIGILRSSNAQLDRNFNGLKSDFSVLESLMIESGQTLQRLQEMVRNQLLTILLAHSIPKFDNFISYNHFSDSWNVIQTALILLFLVVTSNSPHHFLMMFFRSLVPQRERSEFRPHSIIAKNGIKKQGNDRII